ncbi:hypothetical protein AB0L65_03560 [Nonomuraea sp. NPDC052116]|uniref:hypothetical protein n=1 Tax=Nonomuraea sp. NPDC052116 TaxID=3155665 RepID=UPI0034226812
MVGSDGPSVSVNWKTGSDWRGDQVDVALGRASATETSTTNQISALAPAGMPG